jgi:hypothetical protein
MSPVLFGLYVNDMPSPSHHVELALFADDTAIIAMSRNPTLLVSYLESYLNELQRWLSGWRIAINVSMSTAITFARDARRLIQPRRVKLFGEPIKWVDTTLSLGVTLDTVPAVIEMVYVTLRSYFMAPTSKPKLTNPVEVHDAIRGLKVSKASDLNGKM